MWDALKQVIKQSELYSKQMVFFMAIIGVGTLGFGFFRYVTLSTPQAATEIANNLQPKVDTEAVDYSVVVAADSKVTVNGQAAGGAITYDGGRPQLLLVLVRKTDAYIGSIQALVQVPATPISAGQLQPRIYAVHGVSYSNVEVIDERTLLFTAQDIAQEATVSIGLSFPENYFGNALIPRFETKLSQLSAQTWLLLALGLPFGTVAFLAVLLLRKKLVNVGLNTASLTSKLPSSIAPGMVGSLYHGRIGTREITATLFDLADRGFVTMYHGLDNEISFAKGGQLYTQKTTSLRPFEIFLLHQIFGDTQSISHDYQISVGLESELFSSKIALTMVNLYDGLVEEGFYIASPNSYYLKYQISGMILFFVGAAGAVYGSFAFPEPAYVLFAWVGMMLASLLIVQSTPGLPTRTPLGTTALKDWLAFRNYLTQKDPVSDVQPSQFFDYLPYAIVLDCVDDWMTRWRNETIVLPHWLTASSVPHTADDYKTSLVSVINYLSKHLVSARPPDLA